MSVTLPESVDAWRSVAARCSFDGTLPVATLKRLCEALAGTGGEVRYRVDFGTDTIGTPYVDVDVHAPLTLLCQRTLEPFVSPLAVQTRLGLIRRERDETGLPPGCEPLLVAEDGRLRLADVIEDELLLALPLVPVNPDSRLPDAVLAGPGTDDVADEPKDNPFAVLRGMTKESGRA